MNERTRNRTRLNGVFQDFTDFKPQAGGESGSEEEEEVDSDVRDTIYAHMFFTSKDTQQQKKSVPTSHPSPAGGDLSVSLFVSENDRLSKRLKSGLKNLSRADIKALKRLRREKNRLKRGLLLSDSSSSEVSLDESDSPGHVTTGACVSESPLATSDFRANSSTGRVPRDHEEEEANTKVSIVPDKPDVIVISDSDPASSHDVITVSSEDRSDFELSLNFDEMADLLDREGSEDNMELCDKEEMDQEGITDDWAISKKDLLGREAYERLFEKSLGDRPGRYYNDKAASKCTNCKQRGHSNKNCPWPKRHQVCHFCAAVNHMSSRCPQAMCSYCYQPQHRGRPCSGPCGRPVDCGRCYMQGHIAAICPDQWRQFHNTNYSHDEVVTIHPKRQRSSTKVYCYNCAGSGHYGFECTKTRPRGYYRPHTPLIAKYSLDLWPPRNVDHIRRALGLTPQSQGPSLTPQSQTSTSRHHHSYSEPGYSRKRPPQDFGQEDYETPPTRKHLKKHGGPSGPPDLRNDSDQYSRTNGHRHGSSGNHGDRQLYHHRESEPDLRILINQRQGGGQYESHDFPRTPLLSHRRESCPAPLLPPPSPHTHMPPPFAPPHPHTPLLPPPHHHQRRFSDIPDRRSHEIDRRSHDQSRRSRDFYLPPNRRRDEYHTSDRGFRGSPQTARLLDDHRSSYGRHYRH